MALPIAPTPSTIASYTGSVGGSPMAPPLGWIFLGGQGMRAGVQRRAEAQNTAGTEKESSKLPGYSLFDFILGVKNIPANALSGLRRPTRLSTRTRSLSYPRPAPSSAMRRIFGAKKEQPKAPTLDEATDNLNKRGDV